jgi:ankyrin repeat protein
MPQQPRERQLYIRPRPKVTFVWLVSSWSLMRIWKPKTRTSLRRSSRRWRRIKDKAGWTLLHHAAHNGAVDVLKHLLYPSHEVDVNATCPAGKTALHYCAELTLIEPAKILLSHQSDINALDANSRSPLFFAVNKPLNENRERFVTLLLDNRAQVDLVRLPARHRDYPALQNHPSIIGNPVLSPPRRRESASSMATSGTSQTGRAFLRRFSLKQ